MKRKFFIIDIPDPDGEPPREPPESEPGDDYTKPIMTLGFIAGILSAVQGASSRDVLTIFALSIMIPIIIKAFKNMKA